MLHYLSVIFAVNSTHNLYFASFVQFTEKTRLHRLVVAVIIIYLHLQQCIGHATSL